eukprot:TRINITY_DN1428_c0_g2_i2.p1 TRINITY_DN1428_c0_g2~~TRINITY_DN1428_c0_g2_i2.p1  ORF type:complete len:291 (+),score=104.77 TRINITY_DN1428_c0_g2_i2:1123-1995(+)
MLTCQFYASMSSVVDAQLEKKKPASSEEHLLDESEPQDKKLGERAMLYILMVKSSMKKIEFLLEDENLSHFFFVLMQYSAQVESQPITLLGKRASADQAKADASQAKTRDVQDLASFLPQVHPRIIGGESKLVDEDLIVKILTALPPRAQIRDWVRLYTTNVDGYNIDTFFLRTRFHSDVIIVAKDKNGFIFGAFTTTPWRIDSAHYGNGESFLFSLVPEFRTYRWSHNNDYFQYATKDHISIGSGGGYGLWLDAEFNRGVSQTCETFKNKCLASGEEFTCLALEVWGLE